MASFFAPRLTEEARRAKADYWDVWSDLFCENFFRVQAEWCASNNIEYMVHLNHEDMMPALVRSEGDFFKCMRYVQVPGIDTIWNQIWPGKVADSPKLASSAAHLFGRPRAFSESFAAYRIRPNVEQAKWVIDYQLVRGGTSAIASDFMLKTPPVKHSARIASLRFAHGKRAFNQSLNYSTCQSQFSAKMAKSAKLTSPLLLRFVPELLVRSYFLPLNRSLSRHLVQAFTRISMPWVEP